MVPDAEPDAAPDAVPEAEPDAAPDAAPEAEPDAVPEAAPDAEPEAAPDAEPDAAPDVVPELEPEVVPDVIPDAEPDEPDPEPELVPDVLPELLGLLLAHASASPTAPTATSGAKARRTGYLWNNSEILEKKLAMVTSVRWVRVPTWRSHKRAVSAHIVALSQKYFCQPPGRRSRRIHRSPCAEILDFHLSTSGTASARHPSLDAPGRGGSDRGAPRQCALQVAAYPSRPTFFSRPL
jgi:hypothetical protein